MASKLPRGAGEIIESYQADRREPLPEAPAVGDGNKHRQVTATFRTTGRGRHGVAGRCTSVMSTTTGTQRVPVWRAIPKLLLRRTEVGTATCGDAPVARARAPAPRGQENRYGDSPGRRTRRVQPYASGRATVLPTLPRCGLDRQAQGWQPAPEGGQSSIHLRAAAMRKDGVRVGAAGVGFGGLAGRLGAGLIVPVEDRSVWRGAPDCAAAVLMRPPRSTRRCSPGVLLRRDRIT